MVLDNLRLAGGRTRNEGRVELFLNGKWGTVCDTSWDLEDANVACRQIGYPSASRAVRGGHYGRGTGPIHLDDLRCSGLERNLESCEHTGGHYCNHTMDAGVICHPAGNIMSRYQFILRELNALISGP